MSLSLKNFWRDIIGSSTDGLLLLALVLELGGKPKVSELDFHIFVEEEVSEFEIPMNDLVLVEVFESVNDLSEVGLHLNFSEALPAFDEFVEGLLLPQIIPGWSRAREECRRFRGPRRRVRTERCSGGAAICGF